MQGSCNGKRDRNRWFFAVMQGMQGWAIPKSKNEITTCDGLFLEMIIEELQKRLHPLLFLAKDVSTLAIGDTRSPADPRIVFE